MTPALRSDASVSLPPPCRFESNTGVRIYRVSCQAFPGLVGHCYLLLGAGPVTLVDTGSGFGDSTPQILAGLDAVRTEFGETVRVGDIRRVLITHGHLDHFGGLAQVTGPITAEVGIHELDRWVLESYEERVLVATKAVGFFLETAGVPVAQRRSLLDMYTVAKQRVRPVRPDLTLFDGQILDGIEVIHTPGHCPGQVCLKIGDVLLSADHVLPRTTPHQSPESITAWTGLGHYLEALVKIARVDGVRLALGGHETPFEDFYTRIDAIRVDHERKLARIHGLLSDPDGVSVQDLCARMYPTVKEWHILLALTEIGAHVEYLYQRGGVRVANVGDLAGDGNPALRFTSA